jgi:hypothetical protein
MTQNFRKITQAEFDKLISDNQESPLAVRARELIGKSYPKTAHKVFVKVNCEYNDNWYDIRPTVIVLDGDMNELLPNNNNYFNPDSIFDGFRTGSYEFEVREIIHDFSFFMDGNRKPLPELYVRN